MAPDEFVDGLFEIPKRYQPPKEAKDGPQWRRHKGKRMSCDLCILALSRNETVFASAPATNVRVDGEKVMYLCSKHSSLEKEKDGL